MIYLAQELQAQARKSGRAPFRGGAYHMPSLLTLVGERAKRSTIILLHPDDSASCFWPDDSASRGYRWRKLSPNEAKEAWAAYRNQRRT